MARMFVRGDSHRLRRSAYADHRWLVYGGPAHAGASGRRGHLVQDGLLLALRGGPKRHRGGCFSIGHDRWWLDLKGRMLGKLKPPEKNNTGDLELLRLGTDGSRVRYSSTDGSCGIRE